MKSRWKIWSISLMAASAAVVGCEEVPEPGEPLEEWELPEAVVEPVEEEPEEEAEEFDPVPVEFPGWPGQEEQMTFELMWLGGDEKLELRKAPHRDAEVVATATWLDGEEFDWFDSRIVVETPRPFEVDEGYETMATPFDADDGELEAEDRSVSLKQGDRLYLYRYRGEGSCLMGTREGLVLGSCPEQKLSPQEEELGDYDDPWRAIEEKWWVEVEGDGQRGWFVVTEASVEVHSRRIEGYDDLEGAGEYEELE